MPENKDQKSTLSHNQTSSTRSTSKSSDNQTQNIVIGCLVIAILLAIIGLLVLIFGILPNRAYTVDNKLVVPSLEALPKFTNAEKITVKGKSETGSTVELFVNGDDSKKSAVTKDNGVFEVENVELKEEKVYKFTSAQVKINPLSKVRSDFSNEVSTTVDRTAPAKDVTFDAFSEKTAQTKINVSGKVAEKDGFVIARTSDKEYKATTDKDGKFIVKDIELKKGDNKIEFFVRDQAGNQTNTEKTVTIVMDPAYTQGSINGGGASTNTNTGVGSGGKTAGLPSSAGELEAIVGFVTSGTFVILLSFAAILVVAFVGLKKVLVLKEE